MNAVELIGKKRDGKELTREEIGQFVCGAVDGSFRDYQTAAMLMAIRLNGMSKAETAELTMAMARSGELMDLRAIGGVKVDKHSTGGVGDTTTLILAPLVACAGAKVAKMSGRGLAHTGGTLDKLESIPGFRTSLAREAFIRQVNAVGCAVAGQTGELAPADKVLYALRDVTGTVDSLPLIVSSILSKKIASGADAVVLDVKAGSGAIMPTEEKSVELAETMVEIGNRTGRRFSALVTDMDQPLGLYVGNALEVREAISVLMGETGGPLKEVSLLLGANMLLLAGAVREAEEGVEKLEGFIRSGAGLKKLAEMIAWQGGDPRVTEDPSLLPAADGTLDFCAKESGYLCALRTADIGNAAGALGAGRVKKEDAVDPAAGLVMKKRLGDPVRAGEALLTLHLTERSDLQRATRLLEGAFTIGGERPAPVPLVKRIISPSSPCGRKS